jgi:protein gp37
MRQARRFDYPGGAYAGLTRNGPRGVDWSGKVVLADDDTLTAPLRWRKPRRIFVNSMSDLFHPAVKDEWIDRIFAVMALAPQHTFQVLTKRPERMLKYCDAVNDSDDLAVASCELAEQHGGQGFDFFKTKRIELPLPNVWLGVSCENQETADERIPLLLQTPAAVRFISAEPLLSSIDLHNERSVGDDYDWLTGDNYDWPDGTARSRPARPRLDWVIVGGESGPGARFGDGEWIRSIVQQCSAARVPVFVKQMGTRPHLKDRKGGDPSEWPADLRVRQFPDLLPMTRAKT